jgi:DNA-binding CsgD family transcriptional regulator
MQLERSARRLIGLVYEAAADPGCWSSFLERLGEVVRAPTVSLAIQAAGVGKGTPILTLGSVGLDPAHYRSYAEYYGHTNPALLRGGPLFQEGHVYRDVELCPVAEFHETEFYNDWAAPQRMSHALFGVVLKTKRLVAFTNSVRYRGAPPFSENHLELLRQLNPHLLKAVQLHLRLRDLQSQQAAAGEALDRWSLGVILLGAEGEVVLLNRRAEAILDQCDGLLLDRSGLHAAALNDTIALRKLIAGAMRATIQVQFDVPPGGALALARPSGGRPLELLITPVCRSGVLVPEPGVAAIIFVTDPEEMEQVEVDVLRHLYGFSPAEAEVAALLFQGRDINAITDWLHISRNTAKTHLTHLFEKTGTRRQAELLRLLLRGPASVGPQRAAARPAVQAQAC